MGASGTGSTAILGSEIVSPQPASHKIIITCPIKSHLRLFILLPHLKIIYAIIADYPIFGAKSRHLD
jgi:hypothetical protein